MEAYATCKTGQRPGLRLVEPLSSKPAQAGFDGGGQMLELLLGQLAELVADRVADRLAVPSQQADKWLDSRRAAEYLGIGRDSIRRLAAEGTLPTEQAGVGCKLFFRRSDLDAWRHSSAGLVEPTRCRRHG